MTSMQLVIPAFNQHKQPSVQLGQNRVVVTGQQTMCSTMTDANFLGQPFSVHTNQGLPARQATNQVIYMVDAAGAAKHGVIHQVDRSAVGHTNTQQVVQLANGQFAVISNPCISLAGSGKEPAACVLRSQAGLGSQVLHGNVNLQESNPVGAGILNLSGASGHVSATHHVTSYVQPSAQQLRNGTILARPDTTCLGSAMNAAAPAQQQKQGVLAALKSHTDARKYSQLQDSLNSMHLPSQVR